MSSVEREPGGGPEPVVFQDHGWRRYDLVVLVFDAILGVVVTLLGIVFTVVIGSKGAPPPYLGPIFLAFGAGLAWFGVRTWQMFKRRRVSIFPDRVEVDDGRRITAIPLSEIEGFESRPSDAFQIGVAQCVVLRTKKGRAIRLPLLTRGKNVEGLVQELRQAVLGRA